MLGLRVDDLRGRIGGNVLRRAAEHQVAMWSNGGAVRSAIAQSQYTRVRSRIECAVHRLGTVRIDDQQPALAKIRAAESAACRVVGDLRERNVEASRTGFPRRLFDRQALTRRDDRVVDIDLQDLLDRAEAPVTIRGEQGPEGWIFG